MSGDVEQEYFSDGITEDILTPVAGVRASSSPAIRLSPSRAGPWKPSRSRASSMSPCPRRQHSQNRHPGPHHHSIDRRHVGGRVAERYDRAFGDILRCRMKSRRHGRDRRSGCCPRKERSRPVDPESRSHELYLHAGTTCKGAPEISKSLFGLPPGVGDRCQLFPPGPGGPCEALLCISRSRILGHGAEKALSLDPTLPRRMPRRAGRSPSSAVTRKRSPRETSLRLNPTFDVRIILAAPATRRSI